MSNVALFSFIRVTEEPTKFSGGNAVAYGRNTTSVGMTPVASSVTNKKFRYDYEVDFLYLAPKKTWIDNDLDVSGIITGVLHGSVFMRKCSSMSDERLKTDLEAITPELAESVVLKLKAYSFAFKSDNHKSAGIIAQEIQEILPSLVHTNEDGMLSVDYIALLSYLIPAYQSMFSKVTNLESRLSEIERRVSQNDGS